MKKEETKTGKELIDQTSAGMGENTHTAGKRTPLYDVLSELYLASGDGRNRYDRYDRQNPGCSLENPIVISETEDYVQLEYDVLEMLLQDRPYRVMMQRLVCEDGRYLDQLTLEVAGFDGETGMPSITEEDYWFDITAGYKALSIIFN